MGIGSNVTGIFQQLERLVTAAGKSVTPTAWGNAAKAAKAAEEAASNPGVFSKIGSVAGTVAGGIGSVIALPFKAAFAAGSWMVGAPISLLVLKPIKAVIGGVAGFYEKSPRAASLLTGGAAAVGIGSWVSNRSSARLQENFAASQAMAAQAQAAAFASQPQQSYTNSVTPEDMAAMNARMQEAGKAGSQVEALAARQQAAAPAQTANIAAL